VSVLHEETRGKSRLHCVGKDIVNGGGGGIKPGGPSLIIKKEDPGSCCFLGHLATLQPEVVWSQGNLDLKRQEYAGL